MNGNMKNGIELIKGGIFWLAALAALLVPSVWLAKDRAQGAFWTSKGGGAEHGALANDYNRHGSFSSSKYQY